MMREHFAAFRTFAGTPGTPSQPDRCTGGNLLQTPAPQGFQESGTPGTPGTPQNDEAWREIGFVPHVPQPNDAAETGASEVESPTWRTFSPPPSRIPPTRGQDDWRTRAHVEGLGLRITAPAVELSWAEYDRIADALIAAAGKGSHEAGRLGRAKSKGSVLDDGGRSVFTMGRG